MIPTEHVPERAAALGFRRCRVDAPDARANIDPTFLRRCADAADAADVAIHSLHLFQPLHPLFSGYQRRTDEAFDLFRRAIEGAEICGARVLVWHGASRAEAPPPDAWDRFIDVHRAWPSCAPEAGVTLGIENVSWCVISAVRDVLRLNGALEAMPHAASVGYVFDSFQALEADANPFMLLAAMEGRSSMSTSAMGTRATASQRHLLPGQRRTALAGADQGDRGHRLCRADDAGGADPRSGRDVEQASARARSAPGGGGGGRSLRRATTGRRPGRDRAFQRRRVLRGA